MTLNSPLNSQPEEQESITPLESQSQRKQNPGIHGQKSTDAKSKECNKLGDQVEKAAFLDASLRGAEVFPNLIKVGRADVVMRLPPSNDLYEFDVKSEFYDENTYRKRKTPNGWGAASLDSVREGVWPIVARPLKGGKFEFRWAYATRGRPSKLNPKTNLRCPPGWENFWDGESYKDDGESES